ncbi:MAG: SH3 domain-containing protein, partial [Clostridium sp.]|nr:SH3 domain-containing protein [Clostridium sp.]
EKPETPPAETPSNGNGETLYNLNLRRGAGTSHGILLTIPKGGKVEVLSTSGSWSKVNYKGTVGFVSSQYLKVTEKPADKPVEKPETPPVDSPSNSEGETLYNLNLRKGAGTNYGILLTIPKGGKVEVLSTSGSWSKVNYKGTVGFVSSQYLKVAQETPDSGAGGDEVIETPEHLDGKLKLDVLKNSYNNENVTVTGYAAFSSGLRTVNIFLNNRLQGSAKLNLNRKDLENSKSGFSYTIPSNSVFPGNNALRVEIYETNGKKHILDSTIKMTKTPTIVVDAGHGGSDSGASGYLNGNKIMEKTYTLDIALLLDQELKSRGINSILTRSSDVYVGLSQRANVANNAKADLLVSIHHDYSSGPGPNGAFVMYPSYKNNSVSMSTISESIEVSNKLKQSFLDLGFANRRNGPDTSISGKSLAVLRQTEMRSVLAEIGFISNPSDAAKLNDKVLQKALAKRMAEQLASYFGM